MLTKLKTVTLSFIFIIAYFISIQIGLFVAVTPTGISPFWPTSGLALVSCYLYGKRSAVTIFLGIFLAKLYNLDIFSVPSESLIESIAIAFTTSFSAVIQAIIGAWMIQRSTPKDNPLIEDTIIFRFLLLGVFSCVISPTIGTSLFFFRDMVSTADYISTWFTWWMGNSIGVLIVAPLLLTFLAKPRDIWKPRIKSVTLPLSITLIFMFGLFIYIKKLEYSRLNTLFVNKALPVHRVLEHDLEYIAKSALITQAFFMSSEKVTREEFHQFTKPLLNQYNQSIVALEWIPQINHAYRHRFESQKGENVRIIEKNASEQMIYAIKAKEYYPILFLEPFESNKKVLGFNILANPDAKKILNLVRQKKDLTISAPLLLAQDIKKSYSYIAYAPVYKQLPNRTKFLGVTATVFRISNIVNNILQHLEKNDFSFEIYEKNQLLFKKEIAGFNYTSSEDIQLIKKITIANKEFTVVYTALGHFYSVENSWNLWGILTGGFLFCGFIGVSLLMLTGRTLKTEALVTLRTFELAETQQELTKKNDNLEKALISSKKATKTKSLFLANMSHEIRTPMNAILGFTEILKGMETNLKKAHYIETIQTSGQALLTIINDILDVSKIESGKMQLHYSAISIASLFSELNTLFSQKIQNKGLFSESILDKNMPKSLILDETRLRQVLINLIGNSIKFTHSGSIKLFVSCQFLEEFENSRVNLTFTVSDTGIGIPKSQQQQIFAPFAQIKGQKEKLYGGTGLGLTITQQLIELMNGSVSVESEEKVGTRFTLFIPDVEIASEVDDLHTQNQNYLNVETINFAKATILIVDDVDYNREILATYLADKNFKFIFAENGQEAIEKVNEMNPNLILLDMKMPIMNGYQVSEKLKAFEATKNIPIIAVTAFALSEDEATISQLCEGYLRKPVNKTDLIKELMKFLPYEQDNKSSVNPYQSPEIKPILTKESIAELPSELQQKLKDAITTVDIEEIEKLLEHDSLHETQLANAIKQQIDDFQYEMLLELFD